MVRNTNTRARLLESIVRLAADGGTAAATIRAVAQDVGVTEGAIYRHYRSKEQMLWQAYEQIVTQMATEKAPLVAGAAPVRQRLREWVQLTYAYFDRHPAAFTYVLLMPPPASEASSTPTITTRQGDLLLHLLQQARADGDVRDIDPMLALSHFTGVMLNVPRLINEGRLPGPASQYVDEVAAATWRMLRPCDESD